VPWSIALSKQLAKEMERYNVPWFEKPCRVENIKDYVEVRRSTSMTLARAESLPTAAAFKPNLDREAFGIETFDCSTSGFTDGLRITNLAEVHHRPAAIHSWGSVVSALTGLQLALVMPSCAITEYGFMDHPLNDLPSVEPLRPKDGYFEAPTTSVLGLQFDDGRLQKHPYVATQNTMVSADEADIRLTGIGGRRSVPEGNYSDMVFGNHYLTPAGPHEPATPHS
jgi:D-galactarolactone cycloisomerase